MGSCSKRMEIQATGVDPFLQLVGGDPWSSPASPGLLVPPLSTTAVAAAAGGIAAGVNPADFRYLFLLASYRIPDGGCARIVGFRQGVNLGAPITRVADNVVRLVEFPMTTPYWRFGDGANISWHLRFIPQVATEELRMALWTSSVLPAADAQYLPFNYRPLERENFAFITSDTSSLLFLTATHAAAAAGTFYRNLTGYVPPAKGRPPGIDIAELGTFYDLKTQWQTPDAWHSLDIPVSSAGVIALYASVFQTNPTGRFDAPIPSTNALVGGISPEDQFVANVANPPATVTSTGAIFARVFGALAIEEG